MIDGRINKANAILNGGETLFDSEWLQLADLFQVQWKEALQDVIRILSCEDGSAVDFNEENEHDDDWLRNKSDVFQVYDANQIWLAQTISAIENEDCNIVEQVSITITIY